MRTDELIRTLAADEQSAPDLRKSLALALATVFVLVAMGFVLALGPRPDIASAVTTVRFDLKIVQMALLFCAALTLALRLSVPGASAREAGAGLMAVALLVGTAVAIELAVLPRAQWLPTAIGKNALVCLPAIISMGLPLLAAAICELRLGAPTRPALTGAVAGLVAGAAGAVLYATHCTDDSPLFVALWYSIALSVLTVIGALAGRVMLRW
jgi:hypothetical protein